MTLRQQLRGMTEDQLVGLNKLVVQELNRRQTCKSEDIIAGLEEGDRVFWQRRAGKGPWYSGTVVKCNRTTVNVRTDRGAKVRVPGSLIREE